MTITIPDVAFPYSLFTINPFMESRLYVILEEINYPPSMFTYINVNYVCNEDELFMSYHIFVALNSFIRRKHKRAKQSVINITSSRASPISHNIPSRPRLSSYTVDFITMCWLKVNIVLEIDHTLPATLLCKYFHKHYLLHQLLNRPLLLI